MTRFNQIKIKLLDFFNENPAIKYEKVRMRYLQIFDHLDNQIEVYQNITIDGTPYLDTYAGRAELFATDVYVINLHRQVRHFYGEEFEEYLERKSVAGQ